MATKQDNVNDEEKLKVEEEAKSKAEAEEKAKAEEEAKAKAEAEEKAKKEAKANIAKLRVLIAFTDKYTKQDYQVNDLISVNKDRAEELLSDERGLVEKVN